MSHPRSQLGALRPTGSRCAAGRFGQQKAESLPTRRTFGDRPEATYLVGGIGSGTLFFTAGICRR